MGFWDSGTGQMARTGVGDGSRCCSGGAAGIGAGGSACGAGGGGGGSYARRPNRGRLLSQVDLRSG